MHAQSEWEWILAFGLVLNKVVTRQWLVRETHLNFPPEELMRKCPKCGRYRYSECLHCLYRNGGEIHEREDYSGDLCDEMAKFLNPRTGAWRLENTLKQMRVQFPERTYRDWH